MAVTIPKSSYGDSNEVMKELIARMMDGGKS